MQSKGYKVLKRVLLAAAFLLLFVLIVIPAVSAVFISFRDYSYVRGIFGSKVVGTKNFTQFFGSTVFPIVLANSLPFSLLPTVLSALIAIPLALSVGRMKPGFLRSGVTAALLLPAFIPDMILAGLFMSFWPSTSSLQGWYAAVRANPALFGLCYVPLAAVRPLAVSAFTGACAGAAFRDKGTSPLRGVLMGVLVAQAASLAAFLTTNRELLLLLTEHNNTRVSMTFDTYIYHKTASGVMDDYPLSSAMWVFKSGLQCAAAAVVAAIVVKLTRSRPLTPRPAVPAAAPRWGFLSGLIAALMFAFCALNPMILHIGGAQAVSITDEISALLPGSLMNSLRLTIGAALLSTILLTAFTASLSAGYGAATVTLTLLLCAITNCLPGEYLRYSLRFLAGTDYPILLSSGVSLSYVLAAGYLARLRRPDSGTSLKALLSCLPYIAAFVGVTAASVWGGYFQQMIYLRFSEEYVASQMLRNVLSGAVTADDAVLRSLLLGVVGPVVLIALGTGAAFVFADRYAPRQVQAAGSYVPEQA